MITIESIIAEAQENGASDVHVAPGSRVLYRVNGSLVPAETLGEIDEGDVMMMVSSVCDNAKKQFLATVGEVSVNFSPKELKQTRIHIIKQRGTYSLTIRLLKYTQLYERSDELPEKVYELTTQKRGLFIVSGASGSGRSSHLAGIIQNLNTTEALSIVTVEDNIEYYFKNEKSLITQREVGVDCQSIEDGLSNIIRHDPDVIFISDISNPKVFDIALMLAASGKLVLAGLLAINAVSTLDILLRGSEYKQSLANSLIAILSLQLVPSKNTNNRVLVHELLIANQLVKSAIIDNKLFDIKKIILDSQKQGMCNMDVSLFEKYKNDEISKDTLHKYCHDSELIRRMERDKMING